MKTCRFGDGEKTFLRESVSRRQDYVLIISGKGIDGGETPILDSLALGVGV